MEVHHLFLGQDSLVQAPVLENPAYSALSHSPSLNLTMAPGLECMFRDCEFSTVSVVTDRMGSVLRAQVLGAQRQILLDHMAAVHDVHIAPMTGC